MLFYLCKHIMKLLITEISVHTGNICSDIQDAWTLLFGRYALNVRTNVSSYGPRARLIKAYYCPTKISFKVMRHKPYPSFLRPTPNFYDKNNYRELSRNTHLLETNLNLFKFKCDILSYEVKHHKSSKLFT